MMTTTMLFSLGVAYVVGALTILALEAAGLLIFIRRFSRKQAQEEHRVNDASQPSSTHLDPSFYNKQGIVWILESGKVTKALNGDIAPQEQKRNKGSLEVLPIQKYAKIKDRSLFILESDGSQTEVPLKGCNIAAVSATSLSSRKWAKRYPIKVESKYSELYKGGGMFYIYLDTSWEKEAWCKALRLASCDDKEKLKWFAKLNMEFHTYLTSLNAEYPSFMKPSTGFSVDLIDKSIKFDGYSSKVRQFLKKFAKKTSRSSVQNKPSSSSALVHEERNISDKSRSFQDAGSENMSVLSKPSEDIMVASAVSASSEWGRQSQNNVISDADSNERTCGDEGTLCWNILLSRLFFDAKSNMELKNSVQARIQKMLLNMRSPSFIGELTCTAVDPGDLPPYIHAMRVIPSHMNELWAFEIDIDYSGGANLNIETRLEVQELDLQEGGDKTSESSAVVEVTSDLLEGFEHFGKQLNLSEDKADELVQRDGESRTDGLTSHTTATAASSQVSRWKSMLHSIAKQVSQVPLSLRIRVSSLRGTMRLYIKPPPSDRIWFGFTSMPEIDFNLDPAVGDHRVTSGRLAFFLINRFKVAVRETLVLPNCESICIPWMLAEKDDWVPQKVAPFIWIKQEPASNSMTTQGASTRSVEDKSMVEATRGVPDSYISSRHHRLNKEGHVMQPEIESSDQDASLSAPVTLAGDPLHELATPLLKIDEPGEIVLGNTEEKTEWHMPSPSLVSEGQQNSDVEDDAARPKRIGTRARMLGFGKKMGEKLEEKRRHIEERRRHIVERMKGP